MGVLSGKRLAVGVGLCGVVLMAAICAYPVWRDAKREEENKPSRML